LNASCDPALRAKKRAALCQPSSLLKDPCLSPLEQQRPETDNDHRDLHDPPDPGQ
jgi:hypothetical protein